MPAARYSAERPARPPSSRSNGHARGDADAPFALDALDRRIRLDILLLPGFDLFDLAIAEEIAAVFNRNGHGCAFEVAIGGICDGSVPASCGIAVSAAPAPRPAPNLLILGGAVIAGDQYAPWRFRLRRAAYDRARVFGVAGAVFALAETGLLDGQRAAAPWRSVAAWRTLAPKVRFAPCSWVEGGKFRTCLGGHALANLLLHCISRQFGSEIASAVARRLGAELDLRLLSQAGPANGLAPHSHPALRDAVGAIHRNLGEPLDMAEIRAAARGASKRTLQRLFQRYLRTTICAYYRDCRLEHARQLMRLTSLSVTEVALAAGFESPTHFSQCYKRRFGCPPRRDR
jgi:AraC family carnitine catabolism transcriptional activator